VNASRPYRDKDAAPRYGASIVTAEILRGWLAVSEGGMARPQGENFPVLKGIVAALAISAVIWLLIIAIVE
jgi:hypothetical protein